MYATLNFNVSLVPFVAWHMLTSHALLVASLWDGECNIIATHTLGLSGLLLLGPTVGAYRVEARHMRVSPITVQFGGVQGDGRVLLATREYMLGESLPTLHVILRVGHAHHVKLQALK